MNTTPIDHKIEFMAWDKLGQVMFDNQDILWMSGKVIKLYDQEWFSVNQKDIELMQLTALRSINDEPIYNHMIVKNEHGEYKVVDMFKYALMFSLMMSKLEIVGNRFQHEHLLELCK